MTKPTRIAALCLGVVFLAGAIFGFVAHNLYYEHTARASSPQQARQIYVARLQKDLALSPEQLTQIIAILDQTRQHFGEVKSKVEPEFEALREAQHQRVMAILTPEQQPKYQSILEEYRQRRLRRQQEQGAGR